MTRSDCLILSKRAFSGVSSMCLYISSIVLPVIIIIIIELIDHIKDDSAWLAYTTFFQLSVLIFHLSGFLFGIVFERWTREDEQYQAIPDKV